MHGVLAASATPFDEHFNINIDRLYHHTQNLLENGCNGVAIFGTTGEANSLSLAIRLATIEKLARRDLDTSQYIIGTGSCAVDDSLQLTQLAVTSGFKQVLMLPPFYYKNITDSGVLRFFDHIINKINDAHLRIYLYHFPKMTGVPFSLKLIDTLRNEFPNLIAGIKDSSGDVHNMIAMCQTFSDFAVFAGTERYLHAVLEAGGAGCISATVNVTAEQARKVYSTWQNHLDATELQTRLTEMRSKLEAWPLIPVVKSILAKRYQDEAWLHMIPPNMPLTNADFEGLTASPQIKELMNSGVESGEKRFNL